MPCRPRSGSTTAGYHGSGGCNLADGSKPTTLRFVTFLALIAAGLAVDRPLALWIQGHLFDGPVYHAGVALLRLENPAGLIAGALLAAALVLRLAGRLKAPWAQRATAAGLSTAVCLAVTIALKFVIGRSQVYPGFLRDHVYALRPFAFDHDYAAFPSATMVASAAFLAALNITHRGGRVAQWCLLGLIAITLLVTSSHWLSDILAGTLLGSTLGPALGRHRALPGTPRAAQG